MNETITAYPLQWPAGWARKQAYQRERAKFSKNERRYGDGGSNWLHKKDLTITDGVERVLGELGRMGVRRADIVISTNVPVRLDGLPLASARIPQDPGVGVYWLKGKQSRCMAVDRYDRVADNLAAIAATLDAMRAIERHGGATILDRAFIGFQALPAPEQWWQVLGIEYTATREQIEDAHGRLAMKHHPDRGGDTDQMARINSARDQGITART